MSDINIKNLVSNQIMSNPIDNSPSSQISEDFASVLGNVINQTDQLQTQASESIKGVALGESANIHQVMIDMEKVSINLEMMVEVRNKMVEAYQEIMRMQV